MIKFYIFKTEFAWFNDSKNDPSQKCEMVHETNFCQGLHMLRSSDGQIDFHLYIHPHKNGNILPVGKKYRTNTFSIHA